MVSCGTYVDVKPVVVGPEYDLQLLAIRFLNAGHPEEQLGPQYRVWFRNNSTRAINRPFNVMREGGWPVADIATLLLGGAVAWALGGLIFRRRDLAAT